MSDQNTGTKAPSDEDNRTCAFPGDQEHDHRMCEDAVAERHARDLAPNLRELVLHATEGNGWTVVAGMAKSIRDLFDRGLVVPRDGVTNCVGVLTDLGRAVRACLDADDEPAVPLEDAFGEAVERQRAARKLAGEQAAGLRALAAMIEANPQIAALLRYAVDSISAYASSAEEMAAFTRAAVAGGAAVRKDYPDDPERHMSVWAAFGPVQVRIHTERAVVCERVVIGVETVTKTVPDPARLAEVPLVEVTEEVEQVRWECRPLLAAESTVAGA